MIVPNAEEAAVLTGLADPERQCARLAEQFPLVVLKLGAEGCLAASGAQRWRVEAPKVTVVDTTGAGDAFVAAFLALRIRGADNPEALAKAVAAGSAAVGWLGGRPPAPHAN